MHKLDFVVPHKLALESPYLTDYFGIWAIHEPTFRALVEKCNGINLHAHLQSLDVRQSVSERDKRSFTLTDDGIAQISVRGPMMKAVPSMAEGTSTVRLRQQIREAGRDPKVKGALLLLDTPGGTVSGNRDLADDVAAFAAQKPIYAFTEDLTASAGVSIASQATKRYANQPTALYGAMGTYGVVLDLSGRAEQLGIKVHVIRAGAFKGVGTEGTAITDEQLAEIQRNINALNEGYLETIARGLGKPLEMVRSLADGRVHTAKDAVGMGLIDGIQSYEATYRQLVAATESTTVSRNTRSNSTMEKTPATLAELKATFPNSSADWRESQIEANADLSGAAVAYATFVEQRSKDKEAALQKDLDAAKAALNTRGKGSDSTLGHQPLKSKGAAPRQAVETDEELQLETGDAIEDFNAAVAQAMGRGPVTLSRRQAAIRSVINRQPELYKSYLLALNPGKRQARLIEEKLGTAAN